MWQSTYKTLVFKTIVFKNEILYSMEYNVKVKVFVLTGITFSFLCACASILNEDDIPLSITFSDGSSGKCKMSNNRASYEVLVPSSQMVRRARSDLNYFCTTRNQETAVGSIPSSIEAVKLAASIIFLDFGITDSITEKARTYPIKNVIDISKSKRMKLAEKEKNDYVSGRDAFNKKHYKTALRVFRPLAEKVLKIIWG